MGYWIVVGGVHDVGGVELLGQFEFGGVQVDRDDVFGFGDAGVLDAVQVDVVVVDDGDRGVCFDLGGVEHGFYFGGDVVADEGGLVEWHVFGDAH